MEQEKVLRNKRMLKRLNKYRQMMNKRMGGEVPALKGEAD